MMEKSKEDKLRKYADRTLAGLIFRTFLYSIVPIFIIYTIRVLTSDQRPEEIIAGTIIGCLLVTFGILVIQKKLAMDKLNKK